MAADAGNVSAVFTLRSSITAKTLVTSYDRAPWRQVTVRLWLLGNTMIPLSEFPAIDATLNGTSALLLTLGYFFIRRKKIQAHKVCMLSAFAASSLFLICYIWYHAHHGVTRFSRQGAVRDLYLTLLGSHTILAVAVVPLVLTTLYQAWRGRFERHRRIARWTFPFWFYVSVTGVVVYWMLYRLYPPVAAALGYVQ